MKKILLCFGITLSLLNANSFKEELVKELSYENENFQIGDGTKFKISNNDKAIIVKGVVKCNEGQGDFIIDSNPNRMCTKFKNEDNFKFKVTLYHLDKTNDKVFADTIVEDWVVKKVDNKIKILRPNGFEVELEKK